MNHNEIDTLLFNGKIYTMINEGDRVEAIGIDRGRIVFAGSMEDSGACIARNRIDLQGKTVFPGFGDSHLHLYAYCQNRSTVGLEDAKSLEDLIRIMKEKADVTEKGKWIKGTGFDQTKFPENRIPTRQDLDRISTEHPVVVRRCCLHIIAANSLAIEMAGLNLNYENGTDVIQGEERKELTEKGERIGLIGRGEDGLIGRDEDGSLNGIFREKATAIFDDIIPNPLADPEEKKKIMQSTFRDMVSKGLTAVHTYAAKIWNYEEDLNTYRELERNDELPLRVVVSLDELFEPEKNPPDKDPNHKVRYGSYKLFTDGSLGARTAALTGPYHDDPEQSGVSVDVGRLTEEVIKAFRSRLQPAIHAIGDKALDLTMDAIEAASMNGIPAESTPVRIIHAQIVRPDQLERLKKLPVILDVQPVFLCTDLHWIEDRLGRDRIRHAYLWKSMMDAGLILAGGSDCPVESYDPAMGIYAAVTRQDPEGFPPEGWQPEERLSVYDAVSLFSKNIAFTTGQEDVLGTIEPGKYADLTVLEEDPFQIEAERLKDLRVAMTFVAGKKVYDREAAQ